jgi:predicted Holliday junction resolvase-like endonuclease
VNGNHDGSDGLKLGDMPELEIEPPKVKFIKTPPMLIVKQELSNADLFSIICGQFESLF